MDGVLGELLERCGGVVRRATALEVVPRWTLERAARDAQLIRALPEVYVDARLAWPDLGCGTPLLALLPPEVGRRAVLAYADGRGALSGPTALDAWGLRTQPQGEALHLDVPPHSAIRSRPHLVVHHRRGLTPAPPEVLIRSGLPMVRLESALVDSWPMLPEPDRPGPVIRAVNDRLTTSRRISAALRTRSRLPGRASLRKLLERLEAGCRSPLEIWGHDRVFVGPGMPEFRRQARIVVGRRAMYLDVYAERERVDFELDGATTHGDPRQREVDLRRDALLATVGIVVVRFSHRRLVHEPDAVRREVLAILASRRLIV
ncbi:DUF559 domain-containing protein [Micromonospora sp. CPCC 205711]|uniref:endonuclease domain-containing protein n=1 Tax=Micromonospora sp. CPCC 205547 TaxID=3122400 RepID=UPI002FF326CE